MSWSFETRVKRESLKGTMGKWHWHLLSIPEIHKAPENTHLHYKRQKGSGSWGRTRPKFAVTVGHFAQEPQKAATTTHTTAQLTKVQPLISHFCAFVHIHLLLRMPTFPIYLLKSCPPLNNAEIFSDHFRLKCCFPMLKFQRVYCMYYSLTLIYSFICSFI